MLLIPFAPAPLLAQAPSKNRITYDQAFAKFLESPDYQATVADLKAIELDFNSRDIVLQPVVEITGERINENRQLGDITSQVTRDRIESLDFTLTKPFSTGTELRLTPSLERANRPPLGGVSRSYGEWQVSVTQNLWQDSFGRSTRLRWTREEMERRRQVAAALLRRAQILIDFENAYWDWAAAVRESELREQNVRKAQEILRWVRDRYNRAAAEPTDLLQARALLANREIQLATVRQSVQQVAARMKRFSPALDWEPSPDDLGKARPVERLITAWSLDKLGETLRLEYLQARFDAEVSSVRAKEARESIRPELDLELVYGKNAIEPSNSAAVQGALDHTHEYSSLGLTFRSGLDLGLERDRVESARAAKMAAEQRAQALAAEATVAWPQLESDIKELKERIVKARELADIQEKNAVAERTRYRKGRSTAFQSLTFEQEAAEAEIRYWTLQSSLRKTEARVRAFAK